VVVCARAELLPSTDARDSAGFRARHPRSFPRSVATIEPTDSAARVGTAEHGREASCPRAMDAVLPQGRLSPVDRRAAARFRFGG
jgi:hypothetical protein